MKRIAAIIAALLLTSVFTMDAQIDIDLLAKLLQTNRVSVEYSCIISGTSPVKSSGTLVGEGNFYMVKADGIEVYSDGETRWTVDPKAKEVYIESSNGIAELMPDVQKFLKQIYELKTSEPVVTPATFKKENFQFKTEGLGKDWMITDLR